MQFRRIISTKRNKALPLPRNSTFKTMMLSIFDDMTQVTETEVERMLNIVDEPQRSEALRFKHLAGRFEHLKTWLMLIEMLKSMGVTNFELQYNEHGKPSLLHYPDIHFNISHCKNGLAVVVDDKPIGIDIESFREPTPALVQKTMNETEAAQIHNTEDFIRFWTMKEAVLKLRGTGIVDDLHTVLDGKGYRLETQVNREKQYVVTVAYSI